MIAYISFLLFFIGCIDAKKGTNTPTETTPTDSVKVGTCILIDTMIRGCVTLVDGIGYRDLGYSKTEVVKYYAILLDCGVWYKNNGWHFTKNWEIYGNGFTDQELNEIHEQQRKGTLNENIFGNIIRDSINRH